MAPRRRFIHPPRMSSPGRRRRGCGFRQRLRLGEPSAGAPKTYASGRPGVNGEPTRGRPSTQTVASSGTRRPLSSNGAFQRANVVSTSSRSCPRSAIRTGCAASGVTAVLVPGDVPGEGEHGLLVHARERHDRRPSARPRLFATPATVRRKRGLVEEVGRLDERQLVVGEATQDRLGDDRLGLLVARAEQRLPERLLTFRGAGGAAAQRDRVPLAHPAAVERDLAAERAHVDELVPSGEKRSVCSPIRSVRSQIAHVRVTLALVTLMPAREAGFRRSGILPLGS